MATKAAYPHSPRHTSLPSDHESPESPRPDSTSPRSPDHYRSSNVDFPDSRDPAPQSPASSPDQQISPGPSPSRSPSPSSPLDRSLSPAPVHRHSSPHHRDHRNTDDDEDDDDIDDDDDDHSYREDKRRDEEEVEEEEDVDLDDVDDDIKLRPPHNERHRSSRRRDNDADSDQQSELDHADREPDSASRSPDPSSGQQSPASGHANGDAPDSDSDDESVQPKRSRNRRSSKLIIPDDMRGSHLYFRRSSRARSAPHRYSAASASSGGSDLDFNIDDEKPDEDDMDIDAADLDDDNVADDDNDDEDYRGDTSHFRRTSRSSRRPVPSARSRQKRSDDEHHLDSDDRASESGSDDDWQSRSSKRTGRRRRRKPSSHMPSKRRRTSDPEDDEVARAARSSSRGGHINYFESDDAEFEKSDQEAVAREIAEYEEVSSNLPHIERIVDYRLREGKPPPPADAVPFSDFKTEDVEFKIKWTNQSYRKCTWETWEVLRSLKGAKRVTNYIKQVEASRDALSKEGVTPEEIAETKVFRAEFRETIRTHEIVNRIFSKRESVSGGSQTEYLVKWTDLSYRDATWEASTDLTSEADIKAIDDFVDRESFASTVAGKKRYNPFGTKEDRPKFKRMVEQPDFLNGEGRTLRDYQLAGLNYLAFSWSKRNNVILADEMGLGKTLQTISFLGWLMYARHILGQFLVIVPLSTIAAWIREFARWLPEMNVVCYIGDSRSREMIRHYELYNEKGAEKFHVLLTTPELVMMDQDHLSRIRYAMIAVDEAHRLKNETSSLHITLASLRSANRLLITGTPLQNSIRELWALLHFLNPEKFTDAEAFEEQFSFTALREPERVSNLHTTLRPYIIRRQKGDVEKSLPKKTYSVLRVGMTHAQQQYYRWLLTRNFTKLNSTVKSRGMGPAQNIRNLLMELKKCCNHPFLFPNYEDTSTTTTVNDLIRPSGKMILLDKLLRRLREKGHRVLIFSQMVRMLDILQDYCRMRQFPCQRLDGSVDNEVRQRAVDHFNAPDSTDFIFLLSTRAGGLGINLATADTVIIFDSDWNPQNDLQAESRAHRIGQKRDVKVFRLLTAESVEEDILERAKRKRVLEHVVIHGVEGGHKSEGKEKEMAFKKEELSAILRFGAEKLFAKDRLNEAQSEEKGREDSMKSEGNDEAPTGRKVSEEESEKEVKAEEKRALAADDIDEILDRAPEDESSQVGGAQPSIGDSLLNAFKWADFKAEEMDEDDDKSGDNMEMARKAASKVMAMNKEAENAQKVEDKERDTFAREGDADFWGRVIPEDMREDVLANDVVLGTRRRKRPNMFNADVDDSTSKRRRVSRAGRPINGRLGMDEELTAKEQRALLRSLRKFGDIGMSKRIVVDSGLDERIEEETALSMLQSCLEKARAAVKEARERRQNEADPSYETNARSAKEAKAKQQRVLIDVLGESGVDAVELLKRCDDLRLMRKHIASFDPDINFRFKNPLKPPSYGTIRWKPANDAMLLVGVYRHGLGNWMRIANDAQLGLGDKIGVAGNTLSKAGAPDSTKLMRRIATLLRELEREIVSASKHPSRTGSTPVDNLHGKNGDKKSKSKGSKRTPSSKKKDVKKDGGMENGAKVVDKYREKRLALKKSHIEKLRELRLLSKSNVKLLPCEKIRRTKECLLHLGKGIDEHCGAREDVEKNLWMYVHEVCRTSLPGDRLEAIYKRIVNAGDKVTDSPSSRK